MLRVYRWHEMSFDSSCDATVVLSVLHCLLWNISQRTESEFIRSKVSMGFWLAGTIATLPHDLKANHATLPNGKDTTLQWHTTMTGLPGISRKEPRVYYRLSSQCQKCNRHFTGHQSLALIHKDYFWLTVTITDTNGCGKPYMLLTYMVTNINVQIRNRTD